MKLGYENYFRPTNCQWAYVVLSFLPHDEKSGPGVHGCCWLVLACLEFHDGHSLSCAVNVSSLAHIAHTEPQLPREEKKNNQVSTWK